MTDRSGRRSRGAGASGSRREEGVPEVEVRRSRRRRRTVSAYREGDRVVVLLPARMSRAEEREWVDVMLERLAAQERRRRPSDQMLLSRARTLCRRYLAELPDDAEPTSVRWVSNQGSRWGSCTPADRTVRLSTRLRGMPRWVIDYVLLHELAHLVEPGHTERFWSLVGRYPRTERARGYLEGVAATADLPLSDLADTADTADTAETADLADAGDPDGPVAPDEFDDADGPADGGDPGGDLVGRAAEGTAAEEPNAGENNGDGPPGAAPVSAELRLFD